MAAMRTVRDLDGVLLVESHKLPSMLLVQYATSEDKAGHGGDYHMESYVRLSILPKELQEQVRDHVRKPLV